ncbi:MAG: DUF6036 family nucleotidyltransferase [Kofleriaceae bacterium]
MGGKTSSTKLSSRIVRSIEAIGQVLARHPSKGMVIGGLAIIARGFERTTNDVDVTFSGADVSIETLLGELHSVGIEPRISDAAEFAAANQVLLVRHTASRVDLDVSRAWLSFELEAIARAEVTKIAGVSLPVARAEDLVIYKMIPWRPRDQQDVERMLLLHGATIDLSRVRRHVRELSEAIEADRLGELDTLVARLSKPAPR